jgi:non-heme chloroperoxidase
MPHLTAPDGATIHYTSSGSGRPLLMVHGLAANSLFFEPAVEPLAREYRVVRMDLRGHGRSGRESVDHSVRLAAQDVHQLLTALELRKVTLVGWSLGAAVSYSYLEQYGDDLLAALVCVDSSPRQTVAPGWEHAAFGGLDANAAADVTRAMADDPDAFVEGLIGNCFAAGSTPDPEMLAMLTKQARSASPRALIGFWESVLAEDFRSLLPTIGIPALLVHGARSRIYPTPAGRWLADTIPDARLELLAESGHLPFVEQQSRFVSALDSFLRECVPA